MVKQMASCSCASSVWVVNLFGSACTDHLGSGDFLVLWNFPFGCELADIHGFGVFEPLEQAAEFFSNWLLPTGSDFWIWMIEEVMQAEPFLQLFIPDAPCLECFHNGELECIDFVCLLEFVGPNVAVKWTQSLELVMNPETLVSSFGDQLQCSFPVVMAGCWDLLQACLDFLCSYVSFAVKSSLSPSLHLTLQRSSWGTHSSTSLSWCFPSNCLLMMVPIGCTCLVLDLAVGPASLLLMGVSLV